MAVVKWVGRLIAGWDMYSSDDGKNFKHQARSESDSHHNVASVISQTYDNYRRAGYTVQIGDTILYPESKDNIKYIENLLRQSSRASPK